MSVSTEVQRTLVKSPPELWTELSNPEALARHLGDFGEIRITKTEPETKVEWEAGEVSGVVQLKQSGWGTKVTLSVTRTPAIPEPLLEPEPVAIAGSGSTIVAEPEPAIAVEPEPAIAAEAVPEPEPVAVEPEPVSPSEPEATLVSTEPEPVPTEPESVAPDPEPQLGFFARLFRKRKAKPTAIVEPEPEVIALAAPEPIEVVALAAPEPIYPDPPAEPEAVEPAEDLASELESLEDQMAAETTELLTGVLDRLGAAHHRPFSRG
ncbi:MAG: hypothetical protein WBV85_06945 [Solirubrobacteraceae bacterium]